MKTCRIAWAVLAVFLTLSGGAFAAETVKVDCQEYARLTGQALPCDANPTLTVPKKDYDRALAKSPAKACREAVKRKYPGVDCQPTRLWSDKGDTPGMACYEELQACEEAAKSKAASKPKKESIKLW